MSGNGQNEEGAKEGGGDDGRDMYRPKNVSTLVRVLTVMAYLLSVSMAAILLSVYYVFVWKSPELPPDGARLAARLAARRADLHNDTAYSHTYDYLGRSNTSVKENATFSLPSNLLEPTYMGRTEDTGVDFESSSNSTTESLYLQTKPLNPNSNDSGTNDTDITT